MEDLKFISTLELYDKVLPFEWNSFCISLSPQIMLLYHNGHIQGMLNLTQDAGNHLKMMSAGHIGGSKFIGLLSDFQIHGRALPGEDLAKWTGCKNQVGFIFILFHFHNNIYKQKFHIDFW